MKLPPIQHLAPEDFPPLLKEINDPPKELYIQGDISPLHTEDGACLTVVGSRKATNYGKDVVDHLIGGLHGYPITIISGLALGIDGYVHKTALDAGLHTIAVPGSGLDASVLYPRSHVSLAQNILASGGGLLSEYEPTQRAALWTFPQRNRIMVGLAHAVLLIEAASRSGTLITARLATEYNRELLVVPGSIFAHSHKGAHQFLKLGATPVTTPHDILDALGILDTTTESTSPHSPASKRVLSLSSEEEEIYEILATPLSRDELISQLSFSVTQANILLSKMELDDLIVEKLGTLRRI